MKIYNADQTLLLDVEVDDNSYRNRAIMGEDNLILYYSLAEHVEVPVGAYCVYEGRTYTLLRPQDIKMEHTRNFAYTVTFSADQDKAKNGSSAIPWTDGCASLLQPSRTNICRCLSTT